MSTQRRHLVSRSRQNESATPGPSRRGRDSQAPTQQTLSLPPYEPPSCPLSAGAKRKIDELRSGRNFTKYEKHLKGSITAVSDSAAACHERLTARKENLDRQAAKRKKDGIVDDEKPQDHVEADNYYRQMANKVKVATKESDKAIRELIDLSDEMRMQDSILREVEENIPDAPPARPARRQRGEDDEDEENEDPEAPAEDPEILSAIELVKKAKENYVTKYQEKSLLKRNFKRLVHSAQYPGEEKPPLPKASTWFPEENGNNPEEDSDDDVVIEGSKKSLKCVLTMRYFEEPWANNLCPHVFEKAGFLEYLNGSGASFTGANGQRGEKKVACPQPGCNKMLAESDMYLDKITIREVQRELKKNSREDYNDDDDDDADDAGAPRGTRRDPEQLGSEDDEDNSMDIDDVRQKRMAKFKREKSMGLSQAPPSHQRSESSEPDEDEIEIMNMTQG
ncbi:related to DNA repair protein MMS21 [Phialocephala subalpina]|uniref:Related to DNA repair protein MMS21 n=1 Tax=Phialocephala subalpina TaxID=576137 RepID=A0A1L7WHJ1_9HELO|nr:related to DNA repair protein MMS21 [Phialocephala subalpina]